MADLPTGSSSTSSNSSDVFLNPSADLWVEDLIRPPQPTEPPRKLPKQNIGYYSPTVPSSVPGWREYLPWNEGGTRPPNRDPIGWNCDQCYFKYLYEGKKLCTNYKFEIPSGAWRCNSWVTGVSKFAPFVKEQTPFANESTLPLVDQQGRFLIDVYKLVNVKPEKNAIFVNGYHSHTSSELIPVFVLGPTPWRFSPAGTYANWVPTNPKNFLPYYKYGDYSQAVVIPMSTLEKPGWIQYDINPISSNFENLRFLPKPNQDLDFLEIGGLEGHVAMYPKREVELFEAGGWDALPEYVSIRWNFLPVIHLQGNSSWRVPGPEIVISSGEDLVSSKPALVAVGEKSVPITLDPKIFLADKVEPIPVRREQLAVSEVSTGLLGIPREEKALNLFEDINRIGIDPTRWIVNKAYQFQSVEPRGWFDSYGVSNNPDEQLSPGTLTFQTALSVESDEANAGVNLICRAPISSFPWRDVSGYGFSAWERARDQWTDPTISFPAYGNPRRNVFSMVELLSRQYFAYQPGRITGFTFGVRACQPEFVGQNSEVLWGIENDENAMYFRLNSGSFSVVRSRFNKKGANYKWATNRLETVFQGSFNGDNINGFGPSGYVMEWNKVTMFKIEYGWYGGVGARLYVYVPVGNKSAKWVRIHNFGPPQSDSEPDTPADLKNKRYPTLSTPWFRVFYRIISANGSTNDQGPLSLSKYGVSVYMDGGNLNSPQITDVTADSKVILPFNQTAPSSGENVTQNDVFPVLAFKYKPKMKKRLTQDSIADVSQGATVARTETTNYKVIVPKKLNLNVTPAALTGSDIPLKIDMWLGESVRESVATKGKTFTYPDIINYSITNPFVDPRNTKIINWPLNSAPWWTLTPPVALTPDWKTDHGVNPTDLAIENRYCPSRPNLFDPTHRRYLLGNDIGDPSVYLRGGIVSGVPTSIDGKFHAMRVFGAGVNDPNDPFLSAFSPYNYTLNNTVDQVSIVQSGSKLDFRHLDMCLVSDPIFESFFNFSFELSGPVYVGVYYHKPSTNIPDRKANAIARIGGHGLFTTENSTNGLGSQNRPWKEMLEQEVADGMWPLFFSPYSLHGPYGLFFENPSDSGGFAHLSQTYENTKYIHDNTPLGLRYNTALTKIVGGSVRGGGLDYITNPNGFGVHFVFLLGPGGSVSNPTVITNASSNDSQKYSMRFLGQPDSAYANSSVHSFLGKIYGKSLVGVNGVNNFPTKSSSQTAYEYIKSLPSLSTSPSFKWGRPNVVLEVKESSERTPLNFKDYNENSGILIDTEATQKLSRERFDLQGSFFVSADKSEISELVSSTLAGSGVSGFSDGPAASSVIGSQVGGSASDSQGNVYFADTNNHRVRKISTDGTVSTYAGTGTAGFLDGKANSDVVVPVATMTNPELITMNNNGDIFFMEPNRHVVRRIDSFTGEVTDWATIPQNLAIYGAMCRNYAGTEIFVSHTPTKKIYSMSSIDPSPTISEYTALVGSNYTLGGMSMDSLNRLYATSVSRHCVLQINLSNNTFSIIAGSTTGVAGSTDSTGNSARFNSPLGISSDDMGAVIYVADNANHTIRRISTQGTVNVTTFIGLAGNPGDISGTNSSSRIRSPVGVTQTFDINATGFQLYFTEGNRVRYASQSTNAFLSSSSNSAGDAIGAVSTSLFSSPKNLIRQLDGTGDVYVADFGNNKIKAVTGFSGGSGLSVTTYAGNGTAGNANGPRLDLPIAQFNSPKALAIDSNDNIYVTDSGSHVVRKITPGGIVSKILGVPNWGVDPFGSGAGATLVSPHGIAVDNNNQRLFVTLPTLNVVLGWTFADGTFVKIGDFGLISGSSTQSGSSDGDTSASRLNNPQNLAVDSTGNVYVADLGNKFIRKISPPATTTASWTTTTLVLGSPNTSVFASPSGLAIDEQNYLYISDLDGDISKLNLTTGVGISIFAGQSGSSGFVNGNGLDTRFSSPAFLGWNSNKKALIVSDQLNFRIRQLIFSRGPYQKKVTSFDLSNFFSYNGTAIRGPGDYTFVVTARNLSSVENGGVPINITASLQCEEG